MRACTAGRAGVSGVSGFAFQGTNAHVILSRCGYNCAHGTLRQGSDRHCLLCLSLYYSAAGDTWLVLNVWLPRRLPQARFSAGTAAPCWDRQRHWHLPRAHRMWSSAGVGPRPYLAQFHADLARAARAELRQHRVAGRLLLPGAAMFEACHAASTTLLGAYHLCCSLH